MFISSLFYVNVSLTFKIIIYRAIGAPGNGKYVVDVIHSRDQRYSRGENNKP